MSVRPFSTPTTQAVRSLVVVLGDQLDADAAAFDGFDNARDLVWMAEAAEESTHVWSTKPRIAIFLSAMRHFADALRARGRPLRYVRLDDPNNRGTLDAELDATLAELKPQRLVLTAPGDWRVWQAVRTVAERAGLPLDVREDRHFYATVREFAAHEKAHKTLRLEYWYRALRGRHGVLMKDGKPVGGRWNFDAENRASFGRRGPDALPVRRRFEPDSITREVFALVETRFADHAGSLASFGWAVTRGDALAVLDDFVASHLAAFGRHQDAMWTGEAFLHHSLLSSALNLKLLNPREVVNAAEAAYHRGDAPLESVEGFVRQIIGWREYVRGVYWTQMPAYLERNELDAHEDLPAFYWSGETEMRCLAESIGQTLAHGYAHHIQRLMVTGLYAMLLGVDPKQVHAWYLAVYVDAVEWVELPNTLGMSQYGDGGLMGSKPYAASGQYIDRMSNYCRGCRYDPKRRLGADACPFTTLYWDFLLRHETRLAGNRRMTMPLKHLARLDAEERLAVRRRASELSRGQI